MSTAPKNQGLGAIPKVMKTGKKKRSRNKKTKGNPAPALDQPASPGKDTSPKAPKPTENVPAPNKPDSPGRDTSPKISVPKEDVNEALKVAIKDTLEEAEKRLTEKFAGKTAATSLHILGNNPIPAQLADGFKYLKTGGVYLRKQ